MEAGPNVLVVFAIRLWANTKGDKGATGIAEFVNYDIQ